MTDSLNSLPGETPPRASAAGPIITIGVLGLLFAATAPIALYTSGPVGLTASGVAAAITLLGIGAASGFGLLFRGPEMLLPRVLGGMLFRMGIPLSAILFLQYRGGPFVDVGIVYYLLVYYLASLFVETLRLWKHCVLTDHAACTAGRQATTPVVGDAING